MVVFETAVLKSGGDSPLISIPQVPSTEREILDATLVQAVESIRCADPSLEAPAAPLVYYAFVVGIGLAVGDHEFVLENFVEFGVGDAFELFKFLG